ncbi:MAG: amidohydrolase family protein [Planctomycetota bacterium]
MTIALPAQERPVAIHNARILTMAGEPIDRGVVLIRNGKIQAVGAEVPIPAGAKRVDAGGGTIMPGLVSAFSRAGLTEPRGDPDQRRSSRRSFRRSRGSRSAPKASNRAARKIADQLYSRQDVFGELAQAGITTLGLAPRDDGFSGRGAVIDPTATDAATMVLNDEAFLLITPVPGSKAKKLVKEALVKAKKLVEERKKPKPAAAKPAEGDKTEAKDEAAKTEGKPADKPQDKKPPTDAAKGKGSAPGQGGPGKGKGKGKPKKDPNIDAIADALEGKTRAFVDLRSAYRLVHYLKAAGDHQFPDTVVVASTLDNNEGRLDEVVKELRGLSEVVLMEAKLTTPAFGRAVECPAATLVDQGFDVGFLLPDQPSQAREVFFALMELVRHGLPQAKALAGVTAVPAQALGVDDRVGTIAAGKDADLLLFTGPPLDPASRLERVWRRGRAVEEAKR